MRIDQVTAIEAADRLGLALLLLDQDGVIVDANETALESYGFTETEVRSMTVGDLCAPHERDAILSAIVEASKDGTLLASEHVRSDGTLFQVEVGVVDVRADGETCRLLTIRDLSRDSAADEELREIERKFAALFEYGPVAVAFLEMIYDGSGVAIDYLVLDTNERYKELMGVDARGMTATQAFPDIRDDPFDWIAMIAGVAQTGEPFHFTQEFRSNWRSYDGVACRYKSDHVAVAFVETTAHLETQVALRESVDTFRFVFEQSSVAKTIVLPTGEVQGNEAFYEMLGYTQEELAPAAPATTWMDLTYPADVEIVRRQVDGLLTGGKSAVRFEQRYLRKDGQVVWTDVSTSLRRDALGQPLYCVATILDVTERKNAELELARRGAQLEELLAERQQNLDQLAMSLSSIIEVVGQLVETRDPYTAGHERRVSQLAVRISAEMGMAPEQIEEVRIAALIHDVGKMSVPAEILSKPGKLSPLELELIRGHAEAGFRILSSAHMGAVIAEMVYQHHERCDGSGYPRGLCEAELAEGSRVLMVADVVEAMMSHRPYRPGLGIEPALEEIEAGAGRIYDQKVVASCVRVFRERGFTFSVS